jgi:REP element-mobilizing transposase RayT
MARPLRLDYSDATWHVTARGNERKPIYRDEGDYLGFLDVLGAVVRRYRWDLHAYVLMPNHYHLLLATPAPTLSRGMRQLGGVYSQRFNRRWSRCGHLFQGRFFSVHVERETHLLELTRYLALNPVRAGLARDPADWPWSSYRATAGIEPPQAFLETTWLRELFRSSRKAAGRAFAEFVAEKNDYDPWSQVRHQVYLGSDSFCSERLDQARAEGPRSGVAARQTRGLISGATAIRRRVLDGRAVADLGRRERNLLALMLRDEALATYAEIGGAIELTSEGARSAISQTRKLLEVDARARRELAVLTARLRETRT